jgi:hypothetical protein
MRRSVDTAFFSRHRPGVFARLSKWFTVLALVMVIGGHWALLQSAAWLGMVVSFSQTDSVSVALEKTFDGQHPCPVCKLVKAGQASEKKQDLQKLETKLDFLTDAGSCALFPPRPIRHFTPASECADASRAAPLLPPPRAV